MLITSKALLVSEPTSQKRWQPISWIRTLLPHTMVTGHRAMNWWRNWLLATAWNWITNDELQMCSRQLLYDTPYVIHPGSHLLHAVAMFFEMLLPDSEMKRNVVSWSVNIVYPNDCLKSVYHWVLVSYDLLHRHARAPEDGLPQPADSHPPGLTGQKAIDDAGWIHRSTNWGSQ